MAKIVADEFESYLSGLTATSNICSTLGNTFTSGSNIYVGIEPIDVATCLTVIPYPGAPPTIEGDRHESSVQIRLKCKSRATALKTMQSIINVFHANTSICDNGKVFATQSSPWIFEFQEGGEYVVTVSNYDIKHVKL